MATNFLWAAGTNGLTSSAFNAMTTELESLTNTSVAVSSVGGSSGLFSQTQTGGSILGEIMLSLGNPGIGSALSAGACLTGWFLKSLDNGTTYESNSVAPPRAPDFIIPLPATTISGGASPFGAPGPVILPAVPFYVLVQNNTGQTFGSGGTTVPYLKIGPIAEQY